MATTSDTFIEAGSREPASMTLADLGWLVIGCGLALSLPGIRFRPEAVYDFEPWRDALVRGPLIALDVMIKGCVALIPVLFARRARFGGMVTPGELLIFVGAAPQFTSVLDNLAWYGQARNPGPIVASLVTPEPTPQDAFWVLKVSAVGVFLTSLLLFTIRGGRGPAWLMALLSGLAVLSFDCGPCDIIREPVTHRLLWLLQPNELVASFIIEATDFPSVLLFALLITMMIVDRRRPAPRPRTTWIVYCSLALNLGFHVGVLTEHVDSNVLFWRAGQVSAAALGGGLFFVGLYVIAGILSAIAVRRIVPAWRRWLANPRRGA